MDTFTYNGDSQRVGKTDQPGTLKYVWDGQNVLIETDASAAIEAVHTLEPALYGNQVSQRRSGATSYYHFDALGSTLQLTDASATVTDSYLYRAFGDLVTSSGTTTNPYQYVGRLGYAYDVDLKGHTVRARRYGPGMGRWLSRDPIGFAGGDANLYRYVGNGPTTLLDSNGLYYVGPFTRVFTSKQSAIITSSLSRLEARLPGIISAIDKELASLPDCVKRATNLNSRNPKSLEYQLSKLREKLSLILDDLKRKDISDPRTKRLAFGHGNFTSPNSPYARTNRYSKYGRSLVVSLFGALTSLEWNAPSPPNTAVIELSDTPGPTGLTWQTMAPAKFDELLLHELSHIYGTEDQGAIKPDSQRNELLYAERFEEILRNPKNPLGPVGVYQYLKSLAQKRCSPDGGSP